MQKPISSLVAKGSGGPSPGRHMHSWNAEVSEQEGGESLEEAAFHHDLYTHNPNPLSLGPFVLPAGPRGWLLSQLPGFQPLSWFLLPTVSRTMASHLPHTSSRNKAHV